MTQIFLRGLPPDERTGILGGRYRFARMSLKNA
jgi:hypothetical protein